MSRKLEIVANHHKECIRIAFESILEVLSIHNTEWEQVTKEQKNFIYECISNSVNDSSATSEFVKELVEASFIDANNPDDEIWEYNEYFPSYQWFHITDREVAVMLDKHYTKGEVN